MDPGTVLIKDPRPLGLKVLGSSTYVCFPRIRGPDMDPK